MAVRASGESGRGRLLGGALVATLLAPLAVALLALVLVAAVAVPVGLGVPLELALLALVRGFTGLHRVRAARILGAPVERPYRPRVERGLVARLKRAAGDPATWRDLAWLPLDATVGVVLRLASLALLLGGLGCLAFPLFWPALPATADPHWVGVVPVGDQASANLVPLEGVALLVLWWGLSPWLMRVDALLSRALLAPTQRSRLASRVRELAQTRAETVDTQAAELRRIERDLHDGVQARLVALGMSLGMAEEVVASDPQAARSLLADAQWATGQALAELRQVVRGIHPPVLADRGIDGAVRALALRIPVPTAVEVGLPEGGLPSPVESAMYFAVAEALANVIKHSEATRAWVRLRHADGRLSVEVGDDGKGGADPSGGTGLRGIQRRLAPFDGTLELASPPGGPTILTMELPCESSSPRTSPSSGTA
jgi:signal transduction histidine kinase